jgi:7,8-dihydroneopterin aldolase/epimerase/oxygenase
MMGCIELKGLEFKAYHGYYDEEQEKGNQFKLDVLLEVDFQKAAEADDLTYTIDYQEIYGIVTRHMQIPSRLLEHVVDNILNELKVRFVRAERIEVKLYKLNPPIGGACEAAVVSNSFIRQT